MIHSDIIVILGLSILIAYILASLVIIAFFHNNYFFWQTYKDRNYTISFGDNTEQKELQDPKIRYWTCKNGEQWVVFLHPWGRNSARMLAQARIYWRRGYSLLFVDARSHGQSQFTAESHGFLYASDLRRVIEAEHIENPIIHGLSFGSIAAVIYAHDYPVRAMVLEALVSDFKYMILDSIRWMHLSPALFGWTANLLLHENLPFDEYEPHDILSKIDVPIFLIHGEEDEMFPVENHFKLNLQSLQQSSSKFDSWVVPGSKHSKMSNHPKYTAKLNSFIYKLEIETEQLKQLV